MSARIVTVVSGATGGFRSAVDQLHRGYAEAGHRPALIRPGGADTERTTPSGPRISVRSPALPGRDGQRTFTRPRAVREAVARLRPARIEVGDRVVLGWLQPWAAANGVPLVLLAHERLDTVWSPRVPGWFPVRATADRVNRRAARSADTVVCLSAYAEDEWRGAEDADVRRVRVGVDLEVFRSAPIRVQRSTPLLVHVGRLSRERSPQRSIEALRVLHAQGVPAALLVLGSGPMRGELERMAQDLPVRFLGQVPDPAAVAHVLSHADVALAPCAVESLGLSVLEALACATPVVAPNRGAAAEFLTPESGELVAPTTEALAAGVRDVLDRDPVARRAAARARAEEFPWSRCVAQLLDVHGLDPLPAGKAPRSA